MANAEVAVLLEMIDQAFDHSAWHGTNLKGSIRGVSAKEAAWRPGKGRHNVWELVVHAAYWKYTVRRRILAEKRGSFELQGSNWFARPERSATTDAAWKADVALLVRTHQSLRAVVEGLSGKDLDATPRGSKRNTRAIVVGIAAHDLYHTGQIQIIKRLMR
jgi:uncharacterized damage-inducible protein DinB